jgi:hypothetical protein
MFKLKITLGNEAMQTPQDIASVLFVLAAKLELMNLGPVDHQNGNIRDLNGNTVGSWSYQPEG